MPRFIVIGLVVSDQWRVTAHARGLMNVQYDLSNVKEMDTGGLEMSSSKVQEYFLIIICRDTSDSIHC